MKRVILRVAACAIVLWLLIPTRDLVSPDWDVFVIDTAGHPIANASVTVFSQQYTIEANDTEDTKITGVDGHVHFNKRQIYAPGAMRLLGVLRNLDQGVHASFGVHTNLHASLKGYGDPTKLEMYTKNDLESRANGSARQVSHIVLLRCPDGYSGFGCDFPDDPDKPILPLQR